ncbi:biotin transport system substrate-specific component [Motilibacter peucedani]|uniref:Biotin transporter n=1 Tax=Motilibacter peucedani TaxID=598650 RepID=A0A420XU19_9ACTN|nr:biotin transporter BioY [Motilibacter peucedani]RKS80257.1 biotin transport system substrate-specific component [Motilibacter peucedani]
MSSLNPALRPARVVADLLPRRAAVDVALVAVAAALTGLSAQVSIPWWPVPLTLQTFAVLLAGSSLGAARASAAMVLYAGAGVAGVPWFAKHTSGWGGPTFGYVLGFVAAALVVGLLSERLSTRKPVQVLAAFALGSVVVYAFGASWLKQDLGVSWSQAADLGIWKFLPGDAVKALAAAGLLPATWALVDRVRRG